MKIINKPSVVMLSEYDGAIEIYLNRVSSLPEVLAVYTMGSIKSPGLSDIDLVVVIKDGYKISNPFLLRTEGINNNLFLHGPVVISESTAKSFQFIIYATNLIKIYGTGQVQDFKSLDYEESDRLRLCYLLDFIESRFGQYAEQANHSEINQRIWMTRLWSITHSCNLAEELGLVLDSKAKNVRNKIIELREGWAVNSSISDAIFLSVMEESVYLLSCLFMSALNKGYPATCEGVTKKLFVANKKITFKKDILDPEYKSKVFCIGRYRFTTLSAIHNSKYLMHLALYDACVRSEGSTQNGCWVNEKRARLVKEHWSWLGRNCKGAGSMTGYLGFSDNHAKTFKQKLEKYVLRTMLYVG